LEVSTVEHTLAVSIFTEEVSAIIPSYRFGVSTAWPGTTELESLFTAELDPFHDDWPHW
jgi:hypothetical protein